MDAKPLFDEKLPPVLNAHPEKAKDIGAIYLSKISGPLGGTWTADFKSNPPKIVPGETGVPECTIEMSDQHFIAVVESPEMGMQFYFQGKLKVTGNPILATKLQSILSLVS